MVDEDQRRTQISADWVLKRIQGGKRVRLNNAVVVGDLELCRLNLPKRHVGRTEIQKQLGLKENIIIVRSAISITNSTIQGRLNFSDSVFINNNGIWFSGTTFINSAWFDGAFFDNGGFFERAIFSSGAGFNHATFSFNAEFAGATFCKVARFIYASFDAIANFPGVRFNTVPGFTGATFKRDAWFNGTTFSDDAWFGISNFKEAAEFYGVNFNGDASFDKAIFDGIAEFYGAAFGKNVDFQGAEFKGDFVTFRDALFKDAKSQEEACRRAKNVLERNGNRDEAGYYFYREMEAKRKQNGIVLPIDFTRLSLADIYRLIKYNLFEYLLFQNLFGGYDVYPFWIIIWWLVVAFGFALFYWYFQGIEGASCLSQCINFSFLVAFTRGFGEFGPKQGFFEMAIETEIVFGLIMFGAFIASITRKYMR